MVLPNLIENPSGVGTIGGSVAMFSMTHTSGTFSTGPLAFTPSLAIYSGAVQGPVGEDSEFSHVVGFATGVGVAIAAGVGVETTLAAAAVSDDSGADDDAIGGHVSAAGAIQTAFSRDLDVTAFSAAGIDLTWSASVTAHRGKLVVIGQMSGGAGVDALGFLSVAVNTALATADVNKVILATGGAGGITVTLPDPTLAAVIGRRIYVKKVDAAAGVITVDNFAAETIDGATSVTIASQYQVIEVVSDGTNWHIL